MLSRLDNGIYTFAESSTDAEPITVHQTTLETACNRLHQALSDVNSAFKAFETDDELRALLTKFCYNADDFYEHRCRINWCIEELNTMLNYAKTHQDTIPDKYDFITLFDAGYRLRTSYKNHYMFEYILQDTEDREIVIEIQFNLDDPDNVAAVRRRTIEFEKVPHGRSSTAIIYEDMSIDETMFKLIHNTKENERRKHDSKASS